MSDDDFRTREQEYALRVFEKINPLIPKDEQAEKDEAKKKWRKAYGSLAHKLPVLIRTAGLSQALAFVKARNKAGTPQQTLLRDLEAVLRQSGALTGDDTLVERSRSAHFEEYMRLTEGALEALLWFKRFAQSELKVQSGADKTDLEEHADAGT